MMHPTPEQIRAKRLEAGHTQPQAAASIGKSFAAWRKWEAPVDSREHRNMDPIFFDLYCARAGLTLIESQ